MRAAIAIAFAAVAIHLVGSGEYGYFRDELYYLDCGRHPAWGYVDFAPFIGWVAWLLQHTLGESLFVIHLLPALAAGAKVLLTAMIVREFGGGRFAIALACLCVLAAPIYLGADSMFTMNTFEPVLWMGAAWVLIRAVRSDRPRLLPWLGLLAGVALLNKHSTVFFLAAVAAGILLAPERRWLRTRWPWLAAAVAIAIFLPNLIWQYHHGWPTIEDLSNVRKTHKNVELGPAAFIAQQLVVMLPFTAPVWIAGIWFLLGDRKGRRWRALGWTFLIFFTILLVLKGKDYYVAPIYPMMFAAGAVWWERSNWVRTRFLITGLIIFGGAVAAFLVLPLLPPDRYIALTRALHYSVPKTEVAHSGPLPQHLGDRFGWPEMTAAVARVYHGMPAADRARTGILAGNYGEAGAINLFGPRLGLPTAVSGHQTYYYWGARGYRGDILILLQQNRRGIEPWCAAVEDGPVVGHPYGMGEEHYTILVCRGLKVPLAMVWPRLKHWN